MDFTACHVFSSTIWLISYFSQWLCTRWRVRNRALVTCSFFVELSALYKSVAPWIQRGNLLKLIYSTSNIRVCTYFVHASIFFDNKSVEISVSHMILYLFLFIEYLYAYNTMCSSISLYWFLRVNFMTHPFQDFIFQWEINRQRASHLA